MTAAVLPWPRGDAPGPNVLLERTVNGLSKRAACVGVFACVALALVLRLAGLESKLPHALEPDGGVIASQVELIQRGDADREQAGTWSLYPHLIAYMAALLPPREPSGNTLDDHLAQASAPFVRVRLVCALLSVLAIPATYAIARRFLERGPALLATMLSAASLLSTLISPQARPHGPAAALVLVAVVAALRMRRRPNLGNCALAGLAFGLAASSLQSGIAAVLPVAAAWWWRATDAKSSTLRFLGPVVMLAIGGGLAFLLYPHSSSVPQQVAGVAPDSAWFLGGHQVQLGHIDGSGFRTVALTLFSFETIPFLFAIVGALVAMLHMRRSFTPLLADKRARDGLVCAAYVIPYLLAIGVYGWTVERFCLPLVPFVACGAAAAWAWCATHVPRTVAALLLGLLVAPQVLASSRMAWLRCQPDGATLMARWIADNVDPNAQRIMLVPALDLPLARTAEELTADAPIAYGSPWVRYQRGGIAETWDCARFSMGYMPLHKSAALAAAALDPIGTAERANSRLVALVVPDREHGHPLAAAFRDALVSSADLSHRSPEQSRDPGNELTLGFDFAVEQNTLWTWALLRGLPHAGRTIELYRLR